MSYNPHIHHRRSIRLKGYDYSQAGAYFITICTHSMKCVFGDVINGEMILNEMGQNANDEWMKLPKRFPRIELDVFQIMPNHMHGILVWGTKGGTGKPCPYDPVGASLADAHSLADAPDANAPIGNIIGAYKSLVFNDCLELYKSRNEFMGKLWQRNFYEHIIRNDYSYQRISNYIINNSANWNKDEFHMQ
jgi:putative transposase